MFGHVQRLDRGRQLLHHAGRRPTGRASGTSRSLRTASASSPMTTTILRLHDRELLDHARDAGRVGERRVADRALHAQRPVDGERVDPQALERLHQRGARAAVEGDALLDLARRAART